MNGWLKALVLLLLVGIVVSLFSGLFFLNSDQTGSGKMARALTIRITLSVLLFLLLLAAYFFGLIRPHDIVPR